MLESTAVPPDYWDRYIEPERDGNALAQPALGDDVEPILLLSQSIVS